MIESLENRLAFADISVVAAGGGVVVTGSDSADEISLQQRGEQIALVAGVGTTVNGVAEVVLDADEAIRGIAFNMRAGNDALRIAGGRHEFGINIRAGQGDDSIVALRTRVKALEIYTDGGNDAIAIEQAQLRKSLQLFGYAGNTGVSLAETRIGNGLSAEFIGGTTRFTAATLDVSKRLTIQLGNKQDVLELSSSRADTAAIYLGGGNDRFDAGGFQTRVLTIDAASGNDEVNLIQADIARRLQISMGGGRNLLRVDSSTILKGVEYADNGTSRIFLSGTRLAGPASLFLSNGRSTALLATNSRFSEVQIALRGSGSTATFVSSPVDTFTALPDNLSTVDRS